MTRLSTSDTGVAVELNGRRYQAPRVPSVVICVDGCDPAYIEHGFATGTIPVIASLRASGFVGYADAVMPTFTNPNNMSIVTGAPPAVHGIAGNYYLDRATGAEIMITDAALLRSETLLACFSRAGIATAAITAKDKLRRALGHGLAGICFSAEASDRCTLAEHGIDDVEVLVGRPRPEPYSADLSLFVLDAGIRLLERARTELLYLSLSDYVQHAHAPGDPAADAFYRALDARVARLLELGAVVAITADHGMNDKARPDGTPAVTYVEDEIARRFGPGAARVICPITDPFVRHHGALGSFVRGYAADPASIPALIAFCRDLDGVELVLDRAEAAARLEQPWDREGDFAIVAERGWVLGARRAEHDLSGLAGHRLRSHGGFSEQRVPFILSRPLAPAYAARAGALRNFDIFEFALNGVVNPSR